MHFSVSVSEMLQAKYPSKYAWTRCRGLLKKTCSSSVQLAKNALVMEAPARSHLLAPGHPPFTRHRSPLHTVGDSLPPVDGVATGGLRQCNSGYCVANIGNVLILATLLSIQQALHQCTELLTVAYLAVLLQFSGREFRECKEQDASMLQTLCAGAGCGAERSARRPTEASHLRQLHMKMAAALPESLQAVQVTWRGSRPAGAAHACGGIWEGRTSQGCTDSARNQLVHGNTGSSGDAHPLRAKAVRLAAAWRAAAEAEGGGGGCGQRQPVEGVDPTLNVVQAAAPSVAEEPALRGMMSRSAKIAPQPILRLLPADTICRLLGNDAQFRVVVEFENLTSEESTAAVRSAGGCVRRTRSRQCDTEDRGQTRPSNDDTRKHDRVCVNQEAWVQDVEEQRWFAVEVRPLQLTP